MTEFLFQTGISNACFALALALLALVVGATARRPHLSYMLWLLVFVKLVTPPIFNIPVPEFALNNGPATVRPIAALDARLGGADHLAFSDESNAEIRKSSGHLTTLQNGWIQAKPGMIALWILGSGLVIVCSLLRVIQFHKLLQANSRPAPPKMRASVKRLAEKLGLGSMPVICTTSARISPLVWWVGGKVQVVVPQSLLDEMDEDSWQWVLAHELAHVRRRDYLVRWLEWFAVACFWWNPVVWWAQRNLRASEELCCDALVLSRLNPDCHSYADSILKTVESLVCPAFRPPAMASEINSGGYLERRVVMIMSGNVMKESSRLLKTFVLGLALVVFPLGLVYGQDFEKVEKKLKKSVEQGHLTQAQAEAMMGTLKQMGERKSDRAPARDEQHETERAAAAEQARDAHAKATAAVEKAVEAGKLSKEAMERRLAGLKDSIAEKMQQADGQEHQFSREDVARAAAEMEKMVAEGKIKKEDMEKRLARMKTAAAETEKSADHARHSLSLKEYEKAAEAMKKMVAEGKAKAEDAEKQLSEIRKMMGESRSEGSGKASDADKARADKLRAISEKIRAAVESGDLTHKEGMEKLAAVQAEMGQTDRAQGDGVESETRRELETVVQKIKAAVESGDMTKDEAERKLKAVKEKIGEGTRAKKTDTNSEAKKETYIEELAREIRQAVDDGKITKEEAEARLKAIKEETKPKKDAEAKKKKDGDGD